MKPIDININLVETYIGLLNNYSEEFKLELISKMFNSIKPNTDSNRKLFYSSFGALKTEKSADEIITEIRRERTFTRKIEDWTIVT